MSREVRAIDPKKSEKKIDRRDDERIKKR